MASYAPMWLILVACALCDWRRRCRIWCLDGSRTPPLIVMLDTVAKHKGVSEEVLLEAVEFAVERGALQLEHGSLAVCRQHL